MKSQATKQEKTAQTVPEATVKRTAAPSRIARIKRWIENIFSSRFFLVVILPLSGLGFIWIHFIEPNRIQIRVEKIKASELPGIKIKKPLRILHLSDLHLVSEQALVRFQDAIEKSIQYRPDLILITGDTCRPENPNLEMVMQTYMTYLSSVFPVYVCMGNHDYEFKSPKLDERLMELLNSSGVKVLIHQKATVIINGTPLTIAGLPDYWTQKLHPERCLDKCQDRTAEHQLTLLLSHNADSLFECGDYQWDIMFSGHTHGGQFRVPFTRYCPLVHVKHSEYAVKDLYRLPDKRLLSVTSGIGNYLEMRFNCFPEVVILEIEP